MVEVVVCAQRLLKRQQRLASGTGSSLRLQAMSHGRRTHFIEMQRFEWRVILAL